MTKKNPDDSVRKEQSGAIENATGTEDATQADNAQELESPGDAGDPEINTETITENEGLKPDETPVIEEVKEEPVVEEVKEEPVVEEVKEEPVLRRLRKNL